MEAPNLVSLHLFIPCLVLVRSAQHLAATIAPLLCVGALKFSAVVKSLRITLRYGVAVLTLWTRNRGSTVDKSMVKWMLGVVLVLMMIE